MNLANEKKGTFLCIVAALFWGLEFTVEKDVLSYIAPNWSNAIRFFIASLILLLVFRKRVSLASAIEWKRGLYAGGLMGLGYAFQTMGLESIDSGINALLCAAYVVIIPFLIWIIKKTRPDSTVFLSAITAIIGVALLSLDDLSGDYVFLGKGEILTLIGSFFYAAGIVAVEHYAKAMDSLLFATIQCVATFIISIIFALLIEPSPDIVNTRLIFEFIYLIIFSSILAQIFFTYGLKYISSHRASILFLLESVSAVIFGRIFLNEKIKTKQILGAILIVIAIIITSLYEANSNKKQACKENIK